MGELNRGSRGMSIFVIGAGAVGGFLGGLLARAGNDVTFLARGEHYRAIREHGLTVKSILGDFQIYPARTVESIAQIQCPGLIIFTVKTYDTVGMAEELSKVVTENTVIISFQNGIDNDNELKKHIMNAKVSSSTTCGRAYRATSTFPSLSAVARTPIP